MLWEWESQGIIFEYHDQDALGLKQVADIIGRNNDEINHIAPFF